MLKMVAVIGSAVVVLVAATSGLAAPAKAQAQNLSLTIMAGDHLYGGGNYAIAPDVPVRVTVTNFTHEFHTFTVPGLDVSEVIHPATANGPGTTTFTFTSHAWGAFAWKRFICPSGLHGRRHQMGGTLYVIIDPSARS